MKVFKYGNDVDTDVIIPARFLNLSTPEHLAAHCMEDIDPTFSQKVCPGDFIVGGWNFGCGSSREHAPLAIKASGVKAVVAKSFARIFYRNAINIGLLIIESPEAAENIKHGDELEIDLARGIVRDLTDGKEYSVPPFPPFIRTIVEKGGLLNCIEDFGGKK